MRNCWRCSSSYCIGTRLYDFVLGQDYWETAKATSPIILELLLEHLLKSVIGKKIIEDCWRCSFQNPAPPEQLSRLAAVPRSLHLRNCILVSQRWLPQQKIHKLYFHLGILKASASLGMPCCANYIYSECI